MKHDKWVATTRPFTPPERELLEHLVPREYPNDSSLLAQIDDVLAYPSCSCGCGPIGFEHSDGVRPGPSHLEPLDTGMAFPVVVDEDGHEVGGLILFTRQGLLDQLEVCSFGQEPLPLPTARHVRFPASE